MTDRETPKFGFAEVHDAQQGEYRAVSGLAVTGLVLGVLSVVALVDPRAALVSAAGALASGLAVWRIARQSPELIGRKAAVIGLMLSLLLGSIALGQCLSDRWLLVRQSRQVAMAWFDLVARDNRTSPINFSFRRTIASRPAAIWKFYCSDQKRYQALEQYLREPVVRTLVALGKGATVRPYATEEVDARAGDRIVVGLYSVTFDRDGRRTTFLVRLVAKRLADDAAGRAVWQITGLEGGIRPAWEGDEKWLTSS